MCAAGAACFFAPPSPLRLPGSAASVAGAARGGASLSLWAGGRAGQAAGRAVSGRRASIARGGAGRRLPLCLARRARFFFSVFISFFSRGPRPPPPTHVRGRSARPGWLRPPRQRRRGVLGDRRKERGESVYARERKEGGGPGTDGGGRALGSLITDLLAPLLSNARSPGRRRRGRRVGARSPGRPAGRGRSLPGNPDRGRPAPGGLRLCGPRPRGRARPPGRPRPLRRDGRLRHAGRPDLPARRLHHPPGLLRGPGAAGLLVRGHPAGPGLRERERKKRLEKKN